MNINITKNREKNIWFKAKYYGWGWYPCTWQGILITLFYVIFIFVFSKTIDETSPTREIFFTFIFPVIIITILFIRIAYKRGEKPGWHWGNKKQ